MNHKKLEKLFLKVKRGELAPDEAAKIAASENYEDLGYANVDHHRRHRQGFPEVIYCAGKTPEQVLGIFGSIRAKGHDVLATRANDKIYTAVKRKFPKSVYHPASRAITLEAKKKKLAGKVLVVTAGTSDIPVAEEAAITARIMGSDVESVYDVGVAGIHRLLDKTPKLRSARVIVVAAGMDGALASVVGGLVSCPVVALPTSVGYGVSFGGIAAMLSMLNSCSAGVAVVNIDNGFGAGALAHKINMLAQTTPHTAKQPDDAIEGRR